MGFLGDLATALPLRVCAWLYPESSASTVAGFNVESTQDMLERVTTYEDGFVPAHTELLPASTSVIESFATAAPEVTTHCDNISLYPLDRYTWFAVTIGHEGMCLCSDDSKLQLLQELGYSASQNAPNWW